MRPMPMLTRNQPILKLCKEHGPSGEHTLGVITRPDVAEAAKARNLVSVMQHEDKSFRFKYEWHVVRNRSSEPEEQSLSQDQRDDLEERFLNGHPWWKQVDSGSRGIEKLRERLRERLFNKAKRELPRLYSMLRDRLGPLEEQLAALGGDEMQEGRLQSMWDAAMNRLYNDARVHSRGKYVSNINDLAPKDDLHLRSRVVDQSEAFRDKLIADGRAWNTRIRPEPAGPDSDLVSVHKPNPPPVRTEKKTHDSLEAEVAEVTDMLKQSRGTELPGFFSPERISQLFWRMSKGWEAITKDHIEQIYLCCKLYFHDVTPEAFRHKARSMGKSGFSKARTIVERLVVPYVVPELDKCKRAALDELTELELDREDFLINADYRFLKDCRNHRESRGLVRGDELAADTGETYLSAMWSHYLIQRNIYIQNVLQQVIERHFLRNLAEILPRRLALNEIGH
ncbi:uncharacterized protein DNG_04993 [Cephalotrichum gorgonifer]|uniref:Dynamin stalk domain-containing protein n=1 Tax=Cephalotrichum gorgonifer TaxID=2041049 RepID=A0AAE8MZY2_9PEZI|nr:uncharacterized protein DNG_04993 [Cephalotrichum gorgonifer]